MNLIKYFFKLFKRDNRIILDNRSDFDRSFKGTINDPDYYTNPSSYKGNDHLPNIRGINPPNMF